MQFGVRGFISPYPMGLLGFVLAKSLAQILAAWCNAGEGRCYA